MPLQLLNLGVVIPRILMRIFVTRTPRGEQGLLCPSYCADDAPSRLRRAQRAATDQLWRRVPAGNPHLRRHALVQRYAAAHRRLWRSAHLVHDPADLLYLHHAGESALPCRLFEAPNHGVVIRRHVRLWYL